MSNDVNDANREEAAAMGHNLEDLEGIESVWNIENLRLTAEEFAQLTNPAGLTKVRKIAFSSAEKGLGFDVDITMELQTDGKTPAYYTHRLFIKDVVDRIHSRLIEELTK